MTSNQVPRNNLTSPEWGVVAPHPHEDKIPDEIGDMKVTSELRRLYRGFPRMLYERAEHSPQCRKPFDGFTLCMRQLLDKSTCQEVAEIFAPCDKQRRHHRYLKMKMDRVNDSLTTSSKEPTA